MKEMTISVIGMNHKTASLDERSAFAFVLGEEEVRKMMRELGALEAVAVYTCNRFELYTVLDVSGVSPETRPCHSEEALPQKNLKRQERSFEGRGMTNASFRTENSSENVPLPGILREKHMQLFEGWNQKIDRSCLYFWTGKEAVAHLFRVTSSLDSLVIGEAQINGQIKESLRKAQQWKTAGPLLTRLFHHSFGVAKEIRSDTGIGKCSVSVASVAVDLASSVFEQFEEKRVLLIGAGKMAEQALKSLMLRGVAEITVINRTRDHALLLANRFGGRVAEISEMEKCVQETDIILSAIQVRADPLLDSDRLRRLMKERKNRPLFIIDIAVPRSIDQKVSYLDNVYYYEVDDLEEIAQKHFSLRKGERVKAEEIIEAHVGRFWEWMGSLDIVTTLNSFKEKLESIREEVLVRFIPRLQVDEQNRALIEQMTSLIVNKIAHGPMTYLKGISATRGSQKDAALLAEMFDLEESQRDVARRY